MSILRYSNNSARNENTEIFEQFDKRKEQVCYEDSRLALEKDCCRNFCFRLFVISINSIIFNVIEYPLELANHLRLVISKYFNKKLIFKKPLQMYLSKLMNPNK